MERNKAFGHFPLILCLSTAAHAVIGAVLGVQLLRCPTFLDSAISFSTTIVSAPETVRIRWAINSTVLPWISFVKAC
jgi:hypothetical protein